MASEKYLIIDDNGEFEGEIPYTFSRSADTVDDDGNIVASGDMRFGRKTLFSELPVVETIGTSNSGHLLIISGKDADGITDLGWFLDANNATSVRVGTHDNIVRTGSVSRASVGGGDLLNGYPNQNANIAYSPESGQVCHGIIRIVCYRSHWTGSVWEIRGTSILVSQDKGASWTILTDANGDEPAAVNPGQTRGNLWQEGLATPLDDDALTVVNATTDYRGSGGWQCYVSVDIRPNKTTPYTLGALKIFADTAATHAHHARVLVPSDPSYAGKAQLVIQLGDGPASRTIRYICDDILDYLNPAKWGTVQEWFGGGEDPDDELGNVLQWAGSAPLGVGSASCIVATDVDNCAIMKMTVPTDLTSAARVQYDRMWGYANRYYDPLWVHCQSHNGPYVTRATSTLTTAEQRFMYSPDGENWSVVARGEGGLPVIFGGKIIFARHEADGVVHGISLPDAVIRKPVRIGPGGTNLVLAANPGLDWNFNPDVTITYPARNTLGEQPPTPQTNPVMGLAFGGVNGQELAAQITPTGGFGSGHDLPEEEVSFRYYVRLTGNGRTITRHSYGSAFGITVNGGVRATASQWQPVVVSYTNTPAGRSFAHWVYETDNPGGTGVSHKQSYQIAYGELIPATLGSARPILGFPIAANTTATDEDLKLTLGFTTTPWTVGVAIKTPYDSNVGSDFGDYVPSVPLFTLFGNATNYVEFIADQVNDRLTMNVCIAGSITTKQMTGVFWEREEHVRIAVSSDGTTINCAANIGGATVLTSNVTGTLVTQPQDVRFEKADGTTACIDFHGCRLIDGEAYDASELEELTTGLSLGAEIIVTDTSGYLTSITIINSSVPLGQTTDILKPIDIAHDQLSTNETYAIRHDKIESFDKDGSVVSKTHTSDTITDLSIKNPKASYFTPLRVRNKEII
jgi:hypothetical protein